MADAQEAQSDTTDMPGAMERLAYLDDWINQRIAAAHAAEAKLSRRLEAVEQAEDRLKRLLDALRAQTGQTCSILSQITQFQSSGQQQARQILDDFQTQLSHRLQAAAAAISERTGELETRCGIFEDWLTEQLSIAMQSISDQSQRTASDISANLERKLAMYQKGAGDLAAIVEETLRQGMDQLHHQAEQAAQDVAKDVEARLIDRVQSLRLRLHDQALTMRSDLAQSIDHMVNDARNVVALHESQLSRRMEGLRPKLSAAIQQVEGEVAAALSNLTAQAERHGLWIEKRTAQRASELSGTHKSPVEVEVFLNREQRIAEDAA